MLKEENKIFKNLYNNLGWEIDNAIKRDDWKDTKNIISKGREWIINEVKTSELRGRGGAGKPTPSPNEKPPTKNIKVTPKKPTPDEDFAPKPSDKPSTTKPAPQKPSKPAPKSPNDPAPKSPRSPDQTKKIVKDRVQSNIRGPKTPPSAAGRVDIIHKKGTAAYKAARAKFAKKKGAEAARRLDRVYEALMLTLPTLT